MPGAGVESDKKGVTVLLVTLGTDAVTVNAEVAFVDMVLFGSSVGLVAGGVVMVVRLANGGVTTVVFLRTVDDPAVPDKRPVPVGNPVGTKGTTVVELALHVVWTAVEFKRGRLVGGSGVERVVNDADVNNVVLGTKLGRGDTAMVDAEEVARLDVSATVEESAGREDKLGVAVDVVDDASSGRLHEELSVPEVMVVVIVSVRTTGATVLVPL